MLKIRTAVRLLAATAIYLLFLRHTLSVNINLILLSLIGAVTGGYLFLFLSFLRCFRLLGDNRLAIVIGNKSIKVPCSIFFFKRRVVPYSCITSIEFIERGDGSILIGLEKTSPICIEGSLIGGRFNLDDIYSHLYQIGSTSLKKTDLIMGVSKTKIPIVSCSIALLLIVVFLILAPEHHGNSTPNLIIEAGASGKNISYLSDSYRLFSSFFIHLDIFHLIVNVAGFALLGQYVEEVMGRSHTLIIILGSALSGALVSCFLSDYHFVIGSSGGVFGLLGAYTTLRLQNKINIPASLNPTSKKLYLPMAAAGLFMGFILDFVDGFTHAGGFFFGLVIAYMILRENNYNLENQPKILIMLNYSIILALSIAYLYSSYIFLGKVYEIS